MTNAAGRAPAVPPNEDVLSYQLFLAKLTFVPVSLVTCEGGAIGKTSLHIVSKLTPFLCEIR